MLNLHYNGSNSFLFVNAKKMFQFKVKDSEIKPYPLRLGNISKDFTLNNTKKNRVKGNCKSFFVNHNPNDTSCILDKHRFLMEET